MLGSAYLPAADAACGLPVTHQAANAQRAIEDRLGESIEMHVVDLYSLDGADRDAALDAIVAGEPSPLVLVNGELACSGSVDAGAVMAAMARSRSAE